MADPKRLKRVLLVEGQDDQHVVWSLAKRHSLPETFAVEDAKNAPKLLEQIPVRLKAGAGELERLGVLIDADTDLNKRWSQLRGRVQSAGFALPTSPSLGGTVLELNDEIRFGVWVMPDNTLSGMLEDFLATLVPTGDVLMPLVDRFLEALPPPDTCEARFEELHRAKARVHTFLAVQKEPGKPMGQAITARYLDAEAPTAAAFLAWLRRLFVD